MTTEKILARLRIEFPGGPDRLEPVNQSPYVIGRAEDNQLQLPQHLISRHHAQLLFEGEYVRLIDLDSANGTLVGEVRLEPKTPYTLAYGERFQIGAYTLRLEAVTALGQVDPETDPAQTLLLPVQSGEPGRGYSPPNGGPPPALSLNGRVWDDNPFGLPLDNSRYLAYLPPIYSQHPFLGRFLLAFEGVLTSLEQIVDHFDLYLDPQTAPGFFLSELAEWLGVVFDETWPVEKKRLLLAEAFQLYGQRGTRRGLSRFLEIYTGILPQIFEPDDQPHRFNVVIYVPPDQHLVRSTLERIIASYKPAHTTCTLHIFPIRLESEPVEADERVN